MSDFAPVYISCAREANLFADLRVESRGNLVRLTSAADVELTPADARHLAQVLMEKIGESVVPTLELPPLAAEEDSLANGIRRVQAALTRANEALERLHEQFRREYDDGR